ncbi:MAG: hypothetical protein GX758_04710 [Tenericutes bacterium]|nr:hypothetical protein [Mycoplasmatota bacterium]
MNTISNCLLLLEVNYGIEITILLMLGISLILAIIILTIIKNTKGK